VSQGNPLTRDVFLARLCQGILAQPWHWFRYHADMTIRGTTHPLFDSLASMAIAVDAAIPGFADRAIGLVSHGSGRDRDERDYEQLLQVLSEITVVSQVALCSWPEGTTMSLEPVAMGSKKNPEISLVWPEGHVGIEVKAPGLRSHQRLRASNPHQLTHRSDLLPRTSDTTLPRDNPVKDFLVSANAKFAGFKATDPAFLGILVIVWDDFINEPIAALLHPSSGLLTSASFHSEGGVPVSYENVDAVVLVRHLHQLARAAADQPLVDGLRHALDYGRPGFPYKVVLPPDAFERLPAALVDCLQLVPWDPLLGAEYGIGDFVMWLDS
jgi:hypothetical protein